MAEGSEKVVMADPAPLIIAYPPIKCNIKQEIQDEHRVVNTVEEENGTLQLPEDSVMMEGLPIIAYRPIPRYIKLESLDEPQEENSVVEENWMLQVPKDSVTSTGHTSAIIDFQIVNASLPSDDSEQSEERLREPTVNETLQDTEMMEDLGSEGSEYDERSERSEHSSLEDFEESDDSLSVNLTDEQEDLIPSPKAGPSNQSKKPTNQALKASHRKKKEEGSNQTAPKKRFSCSKCERSYGHKESLTAHMKNECGIEPQFSCTQCDRRFKKKYNLQVHLICVHKIDREELDKHVPVKERQVMPFKCTKCNSSFRQKRTLDYHMKKECGVAFNCSLCKQNYATKSTLRKHLFKAHNMSSHKLDKYGAGYKVRPIHPYKCDQCGRTYKVKSSLASHLAKCGVEPSFPCPQCDVQCKHKSSLKLHLIEIHKVEPSQLAALGLGPVVRPDNQFKCDRCGTAYKRKQSLKQHLVKKCGK